MGADLMNKNDTATNIIEKIDDEQTVNVLELIKNFITERGD
jgi:hypothetical protein